MSFKGLCLKVRGKYPDDKEALCKCTIAEIVESGKCTMWLVMHDSPCAFFGVWVISVLRSANVILV